MFNHPNKPLTQKIPLSNAVNYEKANHAAGPLKQEEKKEKPTITYQEALRLYSETAQLSSTKLSDTKAAIRIFDQYVVMGVKSKRPYSSAHSLAATFSKMESLKREKRRGYNKRYRRKKVGLLREPAQKHALEAAPLKRSDNNRLTLIKAIMALPVDAESKVTMIETILRVEA